VASVTRKKATAESSLEPGTLEAYLGNKEVNLNSVSGSVEVAGPNLVPQLGPQALEE
jgi:hypothetical protein